ncbi:sensor histidine kinase [Tenuibacillus multivorans]|uniref:histidine kinase n=1 Tax=Tenuibacillus multivorans TaxID=237069 RepID=A0A1H0FH70_9BACI|nr:HAMP domain-containing sensor histidine kinase [Tenuibacillus multivorans]GEL77653.1 histidine kinase [Tenuibacillus multivorans]SDN93769.1 Signal transduction histidine kinase [Tenuibacillus multivorans]
MLVVGIIILVIALGVLSAYLLMYKRQIKSLDRQLDFIRQNDTNRHLKLSLQADELQRLAKQINAVLVNARDEKVSLYKAEQAFKEAITNVSHDLRTPLTSVVGYIDMLESGKITDIERDEYYQIVKERVRHLVQMLDDLFEFARIESGEFEPASEKVDVGQTFLETIYLFHYDFSNKKAEPQLKLPDVPLYIIGDTEVLKRIYENVIRNALTHGEGDLKVKIEKTDGKAVIHLQNHAPDLQEQEIQKLFERFYTTETSRHRKTTGLGLSIARRLVDMMDGEITAEKKGENLVVSIQFDLLSK